MTNELGTYRIDKVSITTTPLEEDFYLVILNGNRGIRDRCIEVSN